MDDLEFELEIKNDFLEESEDLLTNAENAFLQLVVGGENQELLDEIFRLAHNLKGTSKAVGFDQLSHLTHIAENLILKLKEGSLEVTDPIVTVLLKFKDLVTTIIFGLKDNIDAEFDITTIVQELEDATEQKASVAEIKETPDIQMEDQVSAPVEAEVEAEVQIEVEAVDPVIFKEETTQVAPTPINTIPKKEKKANDSNESIRVNLSKIDEVTDLIGELVILQTAIFQRRFEFIKDEVSIKTITTMEKLFKDLQDQTLSLRMLPIKNAFQKMNRIVRDTSAQLNKDVHLSLVGEETEVDKTVLERLSDPLVHIVRNSLDHGLESTEDRVKAGKDPKGSVELMAYHEGNKLIIQITDDGKGIDPNIIFNKAIEKGVIPETAKMSESEILQLIFHPGFSTKEQVSEVSGRGVGMDVVKTNIEDLGGEVKLMSKLGEGTSIKIILPLTLTIIDALVIRSLQKKVVLPLSQVHEIVIVNSKDIESFSNMACLYKLRGEVVPIFSLNAKLGEADNLKVKNTVIIIKGATTFGVIVDEILFQQQIVIKKLGDDMAGRPGIMGSAIMSDGKPSLILDFFDLFKSNMKQSRSNIVNKRLTA